MILRVGLTGGIASGKSTVRKIFDDLGCRTVDADAIVSELYAPGRAGHQALVETYGREILAADGTIDRPRLSIIALATPEGASQLNRLIHPLVIEEQTRRMSDLEASGVDAIYVVEATLLLESGGRERFEKIVVVDVDPPTQIRRAVARGLDAAEAERRIARQMPRSERLMFADYVIDNRGDLAELRRGTIEVYETLQADLARKKSVDQP